MLLNSVFIYHYMLKIIAETLWLFLPAIAANMTPVLFARYNWLSSLNKPLDGYQTWRGRRLLGDNKTVRGLILGITAGLLVGLIQFYASRLPVFSNISLIDYSSLIVALTTGGLLAFSALAGDAIKSFFKRQLNIAPGRPWVPFDQIDFIIGAFLISVLFASLTLAHLLTALTLIGFGSYLTSHIGIALNIKKSL